MLYTFQKLKIILYRIQNNIEQADKVNKYLNLFSFYPKNISKKLLQKKISFYSILFFIFHNKKRRIK